MMEIGRRYKIMNPDKMRSEYGKAMYMLQDCVNPEISSELGIDLRSEIVTVYSYLEGNDSTTNY